MSRVITLPRGALCISIDLELLWGVWDNAPTPADRDCGALERVICRELVALFERHDIAATWATVGRLLDDAPGFDGLRGDRSCWFAPDIVEAVRRSGVGHELASHSHSHLYFGVSSAEDVAADLARAALVHERHALPFTSFVFPRNQLGHLPALRAAGLRVYRSHDAGMLRWFDRHAPALRSAANFAEKALALPPPVVDAVVDAHGLVDVPSSMLLIGRNGVRRAIHPAALVRKLSSGLRRAAEEGRVFHLWFHPSNFYRARDAQLEVLGACLREASELRRSGQLDVLRMCDFVERAEASAPRITSASRSATTEPA